jgi:hypothetical protein
MLIVLSNHIRSGDRMDIHKNAGLTLHSLLSEKHLQCELDEARSARLGNLPKGDAVSDVSVRLKELRMVPNVEEFGAELHA